jgi:hypothetical protein
MAGWSQLIAAPGTVARALVCDSEDAAGRWRSGRSKLTGEWPGLLRHPSPELSRRSVIVRPAT